MSTAVLSLGSNLGDRAEHLRGALRLLAPWTTAVSPVFQTPPWGPVAQEDYLNIIVLAADDADGADDPWPWLERARACERAAGRVRDVRWGPRTLDVDVVTVDGARGAIRSADPELTLPHPRAHERAFVLVPWLALDPGAELPGHGAVADLVAGLDPAERDGVRRRADVTLC